ncbi:MAG TPA: hypothetical protein ACFYD2_06295 [Candidatus Avalokitesvara rifleensis]|uniref:hypothetical protein n=1 Tax=Candidatus Avalokitesvara rifleensis TaxID=3367620 RepID=UPI0027123BB4|nr:hypothetical protein [Candidatus Brocadiales bacterium]
MDFLYSILRNIWEAWLGLKNGLLWPSEQTPQEKEVHLDKAVAEEIARQVARQVGELSPKKTESPRPIRISPQGTIEIKTDYVPSVSDVKSDGEKIQTNLGSIKSEEDKSNDIETSIKALKEIGGKKQRKN